MSSSGMENLKPVDDAGDKSYNNGQKELTADQQKKMNELVSQIVQQKQNELATGDVNTILAKLKENTPEAALYRALLLQQLENAVKKDKKEGKDDEEKPGWLTRAYRWVKSKAWATTKVLGMSAAWYLAMVAANHFMDFKNKGFNATWNQILAEHGIARNPEYAALMGDENAAVDGDILKRNLNFGDLTDQEKVATYNFAKEHMDDGATFDTKTAAFKLIPMYEKDGKVETELPFGSKSDEYNQFFGHVLDTGGKNGTIIPVNSGTIGHRNYDRLFKVGKVETEITPEDNWFTGNTAIRTVDNGLWGFARKYKGIFGENPNAKKKQEAPIIFGPDSDLGVLPAKRQKMSDGTAAVPPVTTASTPAASTPAAPKRISLAQMKEMELNEASAGADNNIRNLVGSVYFGSNSIPVRYTPTAKDMPGILRILKSKRMDVHEAMDMFEKLKSTTYHGIREDDMANFIRDAIKLESVEPIDSKRIPLYQSLIDKYSSTGLPRLPLIMNKPRFDAVAYEGNETIRDPPYSFFTDPWTYAVLTAVGSAFIPGATLPWAAAAIAESFAIPWLANKVYKQEKEKYTKKK